MSDGDHTSLIAHALGECPTVNQTICCLKNREHEREAFTPEFPFPIPMFSNDASPKETVVWLATEGYLENTILNPVD